ncbi:hypothetical protein [Aeromicrobium sp. PE09-221]|uniref:hypothetical protein n=1 Tax=Aeromicrobium sp. PE09-221 TaxID=1898043 RepID=UPI0014820E36|nr:hypothetical protein [Aeromicrobium sp. PE09-221]
MTDETASQRRQRLRRAAELLGDLMPETTSDERDPGGDDTGSREREILRDRPPHHGS